MKNKGKQNRKYLTALLCVCLVVFSSVVYLGESGQIILTGLASVASNLNISFLDRYANFNFERTDGGYYTFVDENNKKEIDYTNRGVFVGDELIAEDNNHYEVVKIDGDTAYCKLIGSEQIVWKDEWGQVPVFNLAQKNKNIVGIYSTHTAESYVPTDGAESKPGMGGIKQVAQTLGEKLKGQGVNTVVSQNNHDPHDSNAYYRSRRTAKELLDQGAQVLVDVHRDGVPDPNFYKAKVDGKEITKIRLVVGKRNPKMQANLEFAKQIKAYYDKNQPGLIKGIFMAKGDYNQDLGPRTILIEVGTHTNNREAAQAGVVNFAAGLPNIIGVSSQQGQPGRPAEPGKPDVKTSPTNKGSWGSAAWLLGLAVIGGGLFLLISTGSMGESMKRVKNFGSRELTSFLGKFTKKDKK